MVGAVCRGCGSPGIQQVVDLGEQPDADYFPATGAAADDPRWPLELWLCRSCTLVQLGPIQPRLPEPPLAVESATSRVHTERSVAALVRRHPELVGSTVYEFASHHGGSWLDHLAQADIRQVTGDDAKAALVVDVHGLAHEPFLGDALRQRVERLAPDGLLVLEFHHLLPLVRGNQFDTIRHGHWAYLSLRALKSLAATFGLSVVHIEQVPLFGGSLQVTLRHQPYSAHTDEAADAVRIVLDAEVSAGLADPVTLRALHQSARESAAALHDELVDYRARGRTVLGYGAPSKAPVLLDLARVGAELLPFTVDAAPAKHGRRIPGTDIPIRSVDALRAARPDAVLLLTWDIADEVVGQLEADGGWGAQYLVPLPEPHLREVARP